MRQSRWLTAQRWRRARNQAKKKEAKKEARKTSLAYLTALAEQNQGCALESSESKQANRQDLRAEALALARQEAEKEHAEAKAQRDAGGPWLPHSREEHDRSNVRRRASKAAVRPYSVTIALFVLPQVCVAQTGEITLTGATCL